jgi:plastocyanin
MSDITRIDPTTGVPIHTVMIEADASGHMTFTPAVLRAKFGDNVEWLCANGDFALNFNSRSPFAIAHFQGRSGTKTVAQKIVATAPGSYHYDVAVSLVDGGIWLNSGSPEIFI